MIAVGSDGALLGSSRAAWLAVRNQINPAGVAVIPVGPMAGAGTKYSVMTKGAFSGTWRTRFAPLQVTHAKPPLTVTKYGLQLGTDSDSSVIVFGALTPMKPILLAANSVNQMRSLAESAAMPASPAELVGTENSVTTPAGVMRAILLAAVCRNQRLLSGPNVIASGDERSVGMANSVIVPEVVIRPILFACWVNHRAPSGPLAMPRGPLPDGREKVVPSAGETANTHRTNDMLQARRRAARQQPRPSRGELS